MKEPLLEENEIQLTEKHRLSFDIRNKILTTRYIKREGKGRAAKESDEYGYGNEKYYGTFTSLAKRLLELELEEKLKESDMKNINDLVNVINEFNDKMDDIATKIAKTLDSKITINVGNKRKEEE